MVTRWWRWLTIVAAITSGICVVVLLLLEIRFFISTIELLNTPVLILRF